VPELGDQLGPFVRGQLAGIHQRRAYERAEADGLVALRELGEVRVEHVLALITRLKQLCNFSPDGSGAPPNCCWNATAR
jgi:hypothetical protein